MMHKRDYRKLATVFDDSTQLIDQKILDKLCYVLKCDNPKFDKVIFTDYIISLRIDDYNRRKS